MLSGQILAREPIRHTFWQIAAAATVGVVAAGTSCFLASSDLYGREKHNASEATMEYAASAMVNTIWYYFLNNVVDNAERPRWSSPIKFALSSLVSIPVGSYLYQSLAPASSLFSKVLCSVDAVGEGGRGFSDTCQCILDLAGVDWEKAGATAPCKFGDVPGTLSLLAQSVGTAVMGAGLWLFGSRSR